MPSAALPPGLSRRRFAAGTLGALMAAATATACRPSGSTDHAGASGPPVAGGEATILLPLEANGLDPATVNPTGVTYGTRLAAVFDQLVRADQATGRIVGQLAESLTPDTTGKVWTLRLRPGLRFSDGTALDAEAVRFNWVRYTDPALHSPQARVAAGLHPQTIDPLTLRITLDQPSMHFDQVVARSLTFVGSPRAIQADPHGFAARPVGAGPFLLRSWVRDDRMVLERNPGYHRSGRPYLDRLVIRTLPDEMQQLNTLASGGADLVLTTGGPTADKARKAGRTVQTTPQGGGFLLVFNTTRPPFDDIRARQAIGWALDSEELVRNVYQTSGAGAHGLFPPGTPFADAALAAARQPDADPGRAQQLLNALAADGKPLSFTFTTLASPVARTTAEFVQSRLGALQHADMQIKVVDGPTYQASVMISRDFQASQYSVSFTDPEPALSDLLHSGGSGNLGGYHDRAVDAALERARASSDPGVRGAAYAEVQRAVVDQVPVWVYLGASSSALTRGTLTGITMFADACLTVDELARTRG